LPTLLTEKQKWYFLKSFEIICTYSYTKQ
jgi:hypothetical protein